MLKSLELHGFKTFAGKTHFSFGDGMTAIVGPNGSGKSNLADAIRWILGEQRPALLRAKKGEDIIFNGTERRARMGMAQGSLILDNQERLLPIDFSEVVIGRRVYRSGESEYLINGNRVRLRDVQELLAHAGVSSDSYVVIGQGLVDAALALRADERRQLFEDAAGLGAFQGKRDDALRRLATSDDHLTRIRDILAEIEPRLKRLKKQAERAEEYHDLTTELRDLLRQQYGYRWGMAVQALSEARTALNAHRITVNSAGDEVSDIEARLTSLRQRQNTVRATITSTLQRRDQLRAESERLRRERAVAAERERGLERERTAFAQEENALLAEIATAQTALTTHDQAGADLQSQQQSGKQSLETARQQLSTAEAERTRLRQQAEEQRRILGRLNGRLNENQQRQRAFGELQKELTREQESHQRALTELNERLTARQQEISTLEEQRTTLQGQQAEMTAERRTLTQQRQQALEQERQAQQALHDTQRRLTELTTRRDVLARLRAEGAGYESGVRALLNADKGVRGTIQAPVADLLRVPEELSIAVGAALAEGLQALVVRDNATAAREWIHARNDGKVTLLPSKLEGGTTLSPSMPSNPDIMGRGAELVQGDDLAILEFLLGDWLIVRDWKVIDHLGNEAQGWNLVTLDGQVRHKDGTIRAGKGKGASNTLLAQSREWSELPRKIEVIEQEQATRQNALNEVRHHLRETEVALQKLEREIADLARHLEKADTALQREQRDAEKVRQELEWRQGLIAKSNAEVGELAQRTTTLQNEAQALQQERGMAEASLRDLEQTITATRPDALRQAVEQQRTLLAVLEEQVVGWQRARTTLADTLHRLNQRFAGRRAQAEQLATETTALAERIAALDHAAQTADQQFQAAQGEIQPLEQEVAVNEEQLAALEEEQLAARRRRHERDEQFHTAQMTLRGAEERLGHLKEQIETDLGMVGLSYVQEDETLIQQAVLPIDELVTSLPKVVDLPEGLEHDVRRLRRRVGLLGAVNPDAPAEYAELDERFTFLTEQSGDLDKACADLRRIVHELDVIMRERFTTTFHAVEKAFRDYFVRLFGGGQAHIELTDPANPTTSGVEIIARPPGKRAQSIALLSGGERALTAAALIFAILKVSPAPFCVLDEVDAMLDEANVGRFRDMLMEHADHTQFIVVTHNRGTIEAARTIYGISQSDPGISEVISLQLDDAVRLSKH
jgi:chromosome segregation protein